MEDLKLDPKLKLWMLLPITVTMVIVGLLRSNVMLLLSPKPKLVPYKQDRERQFIQRVHALRDNKGCLTQDEFVARQNYLIQELKGTNFYAKIETDDSPANPFADVSTNDALMNMAKGNLMSFIPQTLTMAWVSYFFAGSVVMKLPFPLTDGFKGMLQSGVNTPYLNAGYVSAISWYFLTLIGMRAVFTILMDNPEEAAALSAQQNQTMAPMAGPGAPKAEKVFKSEADGLQILEHDQVDLVAKVLAKYE